MQDWLKVNGKGGSGNGITDCEERNTALTRIKERVKRKSSGDYLQRRNACRKEKIKVLVQGGYSAELLKEGKEVGAGTGQSCK